MITEILSGLNRPDLPNNFESSMNRPAIAFKTGTSYGRRDAWAIGYTVEYTVGVWVGNVNQKGNPDIVGSKTAAPLLVDIINSISSGYQKVILPMPNDVGVREVCAKSGWNPSPRCDHLIHDLYSRTRTLNRECEIDKEYLVSLDGKEYFCPSCVGHQAYRVVTFEEYPAELLNFWKTIGKTYAAAPRHNPLCSRLFTGDGPEITSPSDDMIYYFVSKKQKLILQANSGLDVTEHIWYMDDRYVSRNGAGEKLFVTPDEGDHVVTCLDDKGRISRVKLTIKYAM
jgi:penicillin-binding protein 1C